nr:MAG: hypothetical protein [Sichuan deltaflexi-like virus 3]
MKRTVDSRVTPGVQSASPSSPSPPPPRPPAMSLIGDTAQLHQTRIAFNAVITVTGPSGYHHEPLASATGFVQLVGARASVRVVSETLVCQVIGPASANRSVDAFVCVLPASLPAASFPTTAAQILTVGGSAFCQHSIYVGSTPVPLAFAQEVAHQLKPAPLVGSPPEVCFYYNVAGGGANDTVHLRVSGLLEVDGVGFVQSW